MPEDPALLIFPDEYVSNAEGVPYHEKWARANPAEAAKWVVFRNDVIARKQVDPPSMATKYGRALVAAGKEHMSISRVLGTMVPANPPPGTPPTVTGDLYFTGDFETNNTLQWPDLHDNPTNGRLIVPQPATAGAHSQYAWRCQASSTISSGTGGGPSNFVGHNVDAEWERPGRLTFYRYKILFPSGSHPNFPGQFIPPTNVSINTHLAFHQVNVGSYSTHFGFNSSAGGALGQVFWLQVAGGDVNIARQWFWDRQADNATAIPIQYDTWGEVVVEVFWSHLGSIGSSPGYFKLWIDWGSGRRLLCPPASGMDYYGAPWPLNRPTLWRKADGSYDPVWLEFGQYRYSDPGAVPATSQETSIYMDDFKVGSTLSAVGG